MSPSAEQEELQFTLAVHIKYNTGYLVENHLNRVAKIS